MTKKNYTIDNNNMTITANLSKLNDMEKQIVKDHVELGYTFVSKVVTRDGSKRKRTYFENNLIDVDREIFKDLENATGADGKKKKGAYSKASSFASTIIKLGKYVENHADEAEILDHYRDLVMKDFVEAKLYAKSVLAAA